MFGPLTGRRLPAADHEDDWDEDSALLPCPYQPRDIAL